MYTVVFHIALSLVDCRVLIGAAGAALIKERITVVSTKSTPVASPLTVRFMIRVSPAGWLCTTHWSSEVILWTRTSMPLYQVSDDALMVRTMSSY